MALALALTLPHLASAQATTQAGPSTTQIKGLLAELADPDAQVRDDAAQALMGLSRDDLPLLTRAISEAPPLTPGQLSLMHDVVGQIYLASDDYLKEPGDPPLLGITWSSAMAPMLVEPGVRAGARLMGFSTFRMLRDGDRLISIKDVHEVPITMALLPTLISQYRPGQTITVNILRQGRPMAVPLTIKAKPLHTGTIDALEQWSIARQEKMEEFWQEQFLPAIGRGASATAPAE